MDTTALDRFEKILEDGLVKICRSEGLLDEILNSPDIDGVWEAYMKDYVADAVRNFNEYPAAALGFAAFLGMAVANRWDRDWDNAKDAPYSSYYGPRGFDDMDDHILEDVLCLQPEYAKKVSGTVGSCVWSTLALIRHEAIEAQTAEGFYVLVRCYCVMFRIGASIELKRLGYSKVKL